MADGAVVTTPADPIVGIIPEFGTRPGRMDEDALR